MSDGQNVFDMIIVSSFFTYFSYKSIFYVQKIFDFNVDKNVREPIKSKFYRVICTISYFMVNLLFFMLCIDVMTTGTDREILGIKRGIGNCLVTLLDLFVLILLPLAIIRIKSLYYLAYMTIIMCLNFFNYFDSWNKINIFVPKEIQPNSHIDNGLEKISYFNFLLLMIVGRTIWMAYFSFGIVKFLYNLNNKKEREIHSFIHSK
jgi:hypothetical protein